jgi:two-component system cell cycle response regulator
MLAHLLLVDNVAEHLYLGRMLFESRGYSVSTCSSTKEALAFLKDNKVDVIISDVNMPEQDGFEFIKSVKKDATLADIPFVFLTTSQWTESVRTEALSLGADKFVFRPLEPRALITEIEQIIPAAKKAPPA